MKAIVYTQYGSTDVLHLDEVEIPTPKESQVLIKVEAASLNKLDQVTYGGSPVMRLFSGNGLLKPKDKRLGTDLAGRVEAVGSAVTQFRPGDEVFGGGHGSFAEYACARQEYVTLKPANVSFAAAASLPVAGLTALQGLRDRGKIQAGQKVLIYGAGGGVGAFAVQIAKALGAEVTAVCGPHNVERIRLLGADQVIDYSRDDLNQHQARYDLIAAINGYQSIQSYRRALKPQGICVVMGGALTQVVQSLLFGPLLSKRGGQQLGFMGIAKLNQPDMLLLKELLGTGKITPAIDRCYPLSETPQALSYMEEGHARGKIVISVASPYKAEQ